MCSFSRHENVLVPALVAEILSSFYFIVRGVILNLFTLYYELTFLNHLIR